MSSFLHGHGASASQLPSTLGQTTSAASLSVVIASDYTLPVTLSSDVTHPVYMRPTDGSAAYDLPQRSQIPSTIGQKAMAASLAVVLASDQSAIPVSQSGTWSVTQSGTWNITNVSGTVSLPTGAATAANQTTGNSSLSSIDTKLVQHALDTGASTGAIRVVVATRQEAAATPLSNRLSDGSAFYVGAKTGQLPSALGQTTASGSVSVVVASDNTVTVNHGGKTAAYQLRNDYTSTSVTTGAYVQLTASTSSSATRFRIFDSSGSALIFATGAAASETPVLYIPPGGFDAPVELTVASGTRLSVKALDTTASSGQLIISAFV